MLDGSRRDARERAFTLLYEADVKGCTVDELVGEMHLPIEPYAHDLLEGVGVNRGKIDELIQENSKDWDLDRMPIVDRNLLRIAIAELLTQEDVPTAVVIDESVELAKEFSTDEAAKFINGMLSTAASSIRS